jgi:DNA-binding response OmpR family regulator
LVELLKTDPNFSLVVLDLYMPKMDGRQVLNWIRDSTDTAALPVLIRTGSEGVESEAELLESGADDYLTKLLPPNRFLARVRALLRRSAL